MRSEGSVAGGVGPRCGTPDTPVGLGAVREARQECRAYQRPGEARQEWRAYQGCHRVSSHGWAALAVCLLAGLSRPATTQAASALDLAQRLAAEQKLCVVSTLGTAALAKVAVAETEGDALQRLEATGLNVFLAPGQNVMVLADLRPRGTTDTDDRMVLASRLLAALPAEACPERVDRSGREGIVGLPVASLPEEVRALVGRVCPGDTSAASTLYLHLGFGTVLWLVDASGAAPGVARAQWHSPYFLEPPVAAGPEQGLPSRELLWRLSALSVSPLSKLPCPVLPQGEVSLSQLARTAAAGSAGACRVHASLRLIEDSPLWLCGQPSSLGGLLWALTLTTPLRCRPAAEAPRVTEAYYTLQPALVLPPEAAALLSAGYVAPSRAPVLATMLARSDYGKLLPVHAYRPLGDLPLLYHWALAGQHAGTEGLAVVWERTVKLRLTDAARKTPGAPADARIDPRAFHLGVFSVELPML